MSDKMPNLLSFDENLWFMQVCNQNLHSHICLIGCKIGYANRSKLSTDFDHKMQLIGEELCLRGYVGSDYVSLYKV